MNARFKNYVVSLSALLVGLLLIGAVLGQNTTPSANDPYRHLNVFTEVFAKIKSEYVEEPEMQNVTLGAINGLLVAVDPFASYLNADQYKQYLKAKEKPKASIGVVLSRKYSAELSVVDAIPGGPADQMDLSTGDIIEAINGVSTRDMPLAYAEVMLEGEPGSTVELTVLRLQKPEPTVVKVTRAVVRLPAVAAKMIDAETGLVAIQDLSTGKSAGAAAKIQECVKQGMKRLVLDLRHAVVSEPEEGVALANLFLEKGIIATLSGQKVPKRTFEADPSKAIWKGPLVVLTNRGTTGAAEIAAAALQDSKRAKVVGERTYGDAAMRRAVVTSDGGAVLLAVGRYFTPEGKAIQETSVTPAYLVADTDTDEGDETIPAAPAPPKKPGEDAILKKALDVLAGKVEAASAPQQSQPGVQPMRPLNIPANPIKQ